MGDNLILSPRGFFAHDEIGKEIKELYDKRYDSSVNLQSWHYRQSVLRCAKKAFGSSFSQWALTQAKSGYLYGRRLDFLIDTVCFIIGERRALSVTNWYELLEENVNPKKEAVFPRNIERLKSFPLSTTVEAISKWCSQPNGVEDMVCTLNILFGAHRETDLPHQKGVERLTVRLT